MTSRSLLDRPGRRIQVPRQCGPCRLCCNRTCASHERRILYHFHQRPELTWSETCVCFWVLSTVLLWLSLSWPTPSLLPPHTLASLLPLSTSVSMRCADRSRFNSMNSYSLFEPLSFCSLIRSIFKRRRSLFTRFRIRTALHPLFHSDHRHFDQLWFSYTHTHTHAWCIIT